MKRRPNDDTAFPFFFYFVIFSSNVFIPKPNPGPKPKQKLEKIVLRRPLDQFLNDDPPIATFLYFLIFSSNIFTPKPIFGSTLKNLEKFSYNDPAINFETTILQSQYLFIFHPIFLAQNRFLVQNLNKNLEKFSYDDPAIVLVFVFSFFSSNISILKQILGSKLKNLEKFFHDGPAIVQILAQYFSPNFFT